MSVNVLELLFYMDALYRISDAHGCTPYHPIQFSQN